MKQLAIIKLDINPMNFFLIIPLSNHTLHTYILLKANYIHRD